MTEPSAATTTRRRSSSKRQMYAVYYCDLAEPCDRFIRGASTRQVAEDLVHRLNADELARWPQGRPGLPVPLYYLIRSHDE
jgi:hypothetical protein